MTRDSGESEDERRDVATSRADRHSFSLARDAFLLDVDGTILDIAPSPEAVRVPPSLRATLMLLHRATGGAVALISGREIATLDRLFAPLVLAAIGCHGAEWRQESAGAAERRRPLLDDEIKLRSREAVADLPRVHVEDKGYTMAFHYRSAPEHKTALELRLDRVVAAFAELNLLHGKCVIELKANDFNKGEAIRDLMQTTNFAHRRPVFLGDDTTDEDAFAAVRELGGIGIAVGRPMPDTELMLPNPHAARRWLAKLAGATDAQLQWPR